MKHFLLYLFLFGSLTIFSQQKEAYDIGILTDVNLPELLPLLEELKKEIKHKY